MTDVSSVKAYADLQPVSALYAGPPPPAYTNGSPALDGTIEEEESSTIKCICGYSDDDGNTVLCEKCDTWQHIVCYYESAHNVPEVHECTDCLPRSVDAKGAAEKQRLRRELHNIGERKNKSKTTTKNHKKRVKDPLGSVQPNGWAVHSNNDLQYSSERKSGSPRDQGPPTKRPKTSHRPTNSVSTVSQAPALAPASRKRAGSTMNNGHNPVKSPLNVDVNLDEFSPEFMNLYRQPEPPSTDSNSYTDIGVANDISTWLNDRDALAEATGGLQPGDVFQRIDQTIVELEALAPVLVKQKDEDQRTTAHGHHPQWQYLTVETFVPQHAFIGEIKGHIGRKEDYFSDPSNRWDLLRHPEPFVFFPPRLPIYIDTRHEGTILRYLRRSCNPNIEMKILTQGQESGYHFCFIAMHEIEADEELTIGWEVDSEIRQSLHNAVSNGDIRKDGFKKIEPWIANVLSNFGGCACRRGPECLLQRARRPNNNHTDSTQPAKTKGRKTKKPQASPFSTGHATNSRAGSETLNRETLDDENVDGRSTSGSHKSSSRDITPATHFSVDGADMKMSDREKRKLQQQERLFEQLEYDEQHKTKRGKRNSASSALNTPGLPSSKPIGHSEHSPSARTHNGFTRKTSGSSTKTNGRSESKPKPVYADSSTQTEDDGTSAKITTPCPTLKLRVLKRPISFKHKLLQQACAEREQRERSASVKKESHSPALKEVSSVQPSPTRQPATVDTSTSMDIVADAVPAPASVPDESCPARDPTPVPTADVDMEDAEEATTPRPPTPKVEEMPDAPVTEPPSETTHPPTQPPPPPWPNSSDPPPPEEPAAAAATAPEAATATTASAATATTPATTVPTAAVTATVTAATPAPETNQKPADLHVQLPAPDLANPSNPTNSAVTPGSIAGSAVAQSPISVPPPSPFPPSVINSVHPGPTRKKLSLSDYTSRRAKLAQTHSTGTSSTPPLAHSQSANSPTLSTSSLHNPSSPSSKGTEGPSAMLPAVVEEPKVTV